MDETGEKRRKRRLLLISKGLDPDDLEADSKLKMITERENEEASNVYLKRIVIIIRRQKETQREFNCRERTFRGKI